MSKQHIEVPHPSVSPDRMIAHLKFNLVDMVEAGKNPQPVMMWGQPGVGKSDIVKQVGQQSGRPVIDIRLLLKDPTDLSGIPYFNPANKKMEYAAPSELPPTDAELAHFRTAIGDKVVEPSETSPSTAELNAITAKIEAEEVLTDVEKSQLMTVVLSGNAILLLDELSSAAPSVQAAALQLVLDRRIGTYVLPKGVGVVAAGNRTEDRSVHFSMPTPLRNRFAHFNVEVDFDSWQRWAIMNKIHPVVVGFLKANSAKLNDFDPAKKNVYAFATPRTWTFVSDVLWAMSDENGNITRKEDRISLLSDQVASRVGTGVGSEFMASFEVIGKLPDAMDILEGRVKEFSMKDLKLSASYTLIVNLCHRMHDVSTRLKREGDMKEHNAVITQYGDNYFKFLMTNMAFQEDFIILGATIALSQYGIDCANCEQVDVLLDKYDNILTMV